jgi:ABC-2 type transport system permease protein
VTAVLRALPDLLRVGFAGIVAYRAEMTIWILTATLPLIMLALWNAVAAEGPVAGFDQVEIARYFAATLLVRQLTSVWLVWEMNYEIRSGRLSQKLLKPMHPLVQYAVEMIVSVPFRAVILTPLLAGLLWWRPELWLTPEPAAAALFVVSLILAWSINFLVQAVFATFSFWVDKTDGLFGVWFAAWSLLSGYIAPLDTFPDWARQVLVLLPFRGMLGLPVEILGSFVSVADALPQIGLQLFWVAAFAMVLTILWKAGIRRYGAFGA